ncbi:MAG: AsmA family protein [Acidobacteriota bacterium]|nr:AsmA family protein [Acidobacteriota bacterium]
MQLPSQRARIVIAIIVLILVGIFVPPLVTANRLKGRIAGAVSNALGRKASFGEIHLRLLPQPGFDITDFVVEDDPAFSAEPMVRADEVTAYLRLTSLWQGRLEIAQLSLQNPSLNLVRNERGEWNLTAPLERASQVQAAPTAQRRPEARPRFPYVAASDGRINFKFGQEKKSFAFSEADFALWLASENEWRMRLEARPIRSDANLSDTGTLRVEGSAVRAAAPADTAVRFDFEWEKAQLGNLTQLIWGHDRGWRGDVEVSGSVAGTPRELLLSTRARISEFRRYDIFASDAFSADARCTARYLGDAQTLSAIDCHLPSGNGEIATRGMVANLLGDRRWELSVSATDVPMAELARFARHAKKDMLPNLTATGDVDAAFTYRTRGGRNVWTGGGSTSALQLSASGLTPPLEVGAVRFVLGPFPDPLAAPVRKTGSPFTTKTKVKTALADQPMNSRLTVQPFTIALGAAAPLIAEGRVDREAYLLNVRGDAELRRLTALAAAFGLRPAQLGATGTAHLDVALSGDWKGFGAPLVTGNAQLRGVSAEIKGVNSPLQLTSALLTFSASGVDAFNLSASFSGSSVMLQGTLHLPRDCSTLVDCPVRFTLSSPVLNLDDLNRLLNPRFAVHPWYRFLVGTTETTGLRRLQAEGTLSTPRLVMKSVIINHVVTTVHVAGGRVALAGVTAEVFGGKQRGEWTADFSGDAPVYSGTGTLEQADVAQLGAAMRDNWGAGTISAAYKFSASGDTAADLAASAAGELQFGWKNGMLRHVTLRGAQPLRIKRFTGTVQLAGARLTFPAGRMETPEGIYAVSGSSTFARALDFKLAGPVRSYTITGTLEHPQVSSPPDSEAGLKQ